MDVAKRTLSHSDAAGHAGDCGSAKPEAITQEPAGQAGAVTASGPQQEGIPRRFYILDDCLIVWFFQQRPRRTYRAVSSPQALQAIRLAWDTLPPLL